MELLVLDRGAQIADLATPILRGGLQALGEVTEPVATLTLGHVHGLIRVLQQRFRLVGVVGAQRDADAGRDVGHGVAELEGLRQVRDDLLGHGLHVLGVGDPRQDHRELVAAETRNRVGLARAGADAARGLHQQVVAHEVAQRVVDLLEVVQIDQKQRQRATRARGLADLVLEPLPQHAPIGQAGEHVEVGLPPDHLVGLLLLGDV